MNNSKNAPEQPSLKEKRIREITFIYYSRQDIKKAIFEFSKNRECIPRYYEGFGKRPDIFQYDSDILEHVKKGATSFHCSEELWQDPLEISTELSGQEFNNLRIGWDLLIDIDSPYLEYSKTYTRLLIETLRFHGIKNLSVKFSGSKGFHILIPWKAFPEQIYGQKTKDMFPEWPRAICEYLADIIKPKLTEKILEDNSLKQIAEKTGKTEQELVITECLSCNRPAVKKYLITWVCPYCKIEKTAVQKNKRALKCPECSKELFESSRQEIYFCEFCNITSNKNPQMFAKKERVATEKLIDADLVLVAPRHLFRMPYSLHEKTALSSIVIDPEKIQDFQIKDANPFKIEIKNFYPIPEPQEARELLLQALDYQEQKIRNTSRETIKEITSIKKSEYKQIAIPNPDENLFPPCIKLIFQGIKQDGRKRALFILLNFFKSLGVEESEIEKRINEWNKKNYNPLKQGYIQSQLNWYRKSPQRLPPNCTNSLYKELTICKPNELCRQIKNPVSYAIKRHFGRG